MVVNNMRANINVLSYDDHDRAVKILHVLDRTVQDGKVDAIFESEKYTTLTVNKLFSKLKSAEVGRGLTARLTPIISLSSVVEWLSLTLTHLPSSLMSLLDDEFDVLGEDELALLTRWFERLHENRVNTRRTAWTCF
jgi:hypothetical protein